MENINKLNLRVYGILVHEGKFLMMREMYVGKKLVKLPGGGMELGESPKETLVREFKEELNLEVEVGEHIYTQDFFLKSKFKSNEQLMTIYYYVSSNNVKDIKIIEKSIEELIWVSIDEMHEDLFELPVDKVVAKIIREKI
ncbi:MAG: NUDIX domain-containing protein [Flavobacteriales bacterium]|nr:NUDIX domain-containing protein [Flavobacteriales bacterium]